MPLEDYAISVGINRYPKLKPLFGAEADASAFHAWVTAEGGVSKPGNAVRILSSDYPADEPAGSARPAALQVWEFFDRLRQVATDNNEGSEGLGYVAGRRLYMFFAGHGFSPTIDASGILMANADRDAPHNLSPKGWADRFYENGLFEEILLFQDACREPALDVDLTPPYMRLSRVGGAENRKRFYAFAAKSPQLAVEKPISGNPRGIFSATLMEALGGGARDPVTREITAAQLKSYLVTNMVSRLEPVDLENEDIAKRPEVHDLDPMVIVAAPTDGADVPQLFPVQVGLALAAGAVIRDSARKVVATSAGGSQHWNLELPLGLYELLANGQERLFKVSGAIDSTGQPEVVHVN